MYNKTLLKNILILAGLLAVICLPPLAAGLRTAERARAAEARGDMAAASSLYELAAIRLPWRDELWQEAGLATSAGGQAAETIRLLRQAQERGSLTTPGAAVLGEALWETGELEGALEVWLGALSASNPDPAVLGHLAAAYQALGNRAGERETLLNLISVQPQDARAHYRLGLLLAAAKPEEALPELMEAARLDPTLDPNVQTLRKALNTALQVDEPAYRLTAAGQGLGGLGEWALAEEAFAAAAKVRPDYAEAWAWLGEARQQLGQDGGAELSRASVISPDSVLVHILYGLYWQRQGQAGTALEHFLAAAALEPENPAWQAALAEAYVQAGDLPPALSASQRAAELAPQEAQYWRRLADFCVQNRYQIMETGLPAAYRALELAPGDARVLDTMGRLYQEINDPQTARKYFQRAVEIDSTLSSGHLHLGILYLQTGQYDLAKPELLQARDLSPGTPLAEQAQLLLDQYFP